MKCPICSTPLRTIHKYDVEVDTCPDCKGVWLDRGELEKAVGRFSPSDSPRHDHDDPRYERKSWLSSFFDD